MRNKIFKNPINMKEPNKANIYVEDGSLHLKTNGIPFLVDILYDGNIYINSNLGVFFRISYASNRLRIINLINSEMPEVLFSFSGQMTITSCEILTYNGVKFNATRSNNFLEDIINISKTNLEDDTKILREETHKRTPGIRGGYNKPKINPDAIHKGHYNRLEKLDKNQIDTIISNYRDIKRKTFTTKKGTKAVTTIPIKKIIKKIPTPKGGKY